MKKAIYMAAVRTLLIMLCILCFMNCTYASALSNEAALAYSYGETVYIGGMPIGVTLNLEGVTVTNIGNVVTECGACAPAKSAGIEVGDVVLKVNGRQVTKASELTEIVSVSDSVTLLVKRGESEFTVTLVPVVDALTNEKKLGMWVRDNTAGIGTITYMRENGEFAALGHPIVNPTSGEIVKVSQGRVYKGRIVGVVKGKSGKAGELKGMIKREDGVIGEIAENNKFGIYGKLNERQCNHIMDEPVIASGRNCAKVGKAQILTTVSGEEPQLYDIEIVKCVRQKKRADKGMVIKVTDKKLLETSSGIVQGMSGSPILQDGKLIGAVTHVFVNDPTRGYGIYIDWML